jgi:hypothetical protein
VSLVLGVAMLATTAARDAHLPSWAVDELAAAKLDGVDDADAVVVAETWDIRLKGGARDGSRRRIVRVLSEEGREHAAVLLVSDDLAGYKKIRLWHRRPGGAVRKYSNEDGTLFGVAEQRFLDDRSAMFFMPPGVGAGDTIVLDAGFERSESLPQDLFRPQEEIPVLRFSVEVTGRAGWDVEAKWVEGEPANVIEDGRTHRWEFVDLPPSAPARLERAPQPPSLLFALDYVPPEAESPFRDWNATAAWTGRMFELSASEVPTPADDVGIERLASRTGDRARSLRYFSIALGMGGFRPRPPGTTLKRGFGDCKDKTQVMRALLEQAGRPSFPALVMAPSDGYVAGELPSPFAFNHVILAIPWQDRPVGDGMTLVEHPQLGLLRFYDATLSRVSDHDTGLRLQGAPALVLHPDTRELVYLPQRGAIDDAYLERHVWRLDPVGKGTGRFAIETSGYMRSVFETEGGELLADDGLEELARLVVSRVSPGYSELDVEPVRVDPQRGWSVEGRYAMESTVAEAGTIRSVDVGPFLRLDRLPAPDEEGEDSVFLPHLAVWTEIHEVHVEGLGYVGPRDGLRIDNEIGSLVLTVEPTEDGVRLTRRLETRTREIGPERAEGLVALRNALRRANRFVLLFE